MNCYGNYPSLVKKIKEILIRVNTFILINYLFANKLLGTIQLQDLGRLVKVAEDLRVKIILFTQIN